jgi:hypothetical protein
VGRAFNFIKQLAATRRNLDNINEMLEQYQKSGDPIGAFASDDVFKEFAEKVQYMIASGNPAGAAKLVTQIDKPYWWQYILTYRHASMLSGLGTDVKNAYDNLMMIAREMEETLLASPGFAVRRALGTTKEGVSPQEVVGRGYGLMRALLDTKTYNDAWRAFVDGHQSRPYSAKIEMQDARIPGISKVNDALYASDIFFRAFHTNANLYSLGMRQAREQGFTGIRAFEEGSSIAMSGDKKLYDEAVKATDTALLVDTPSKISSWAEVAKAIRPGMDAGAQAAAFVGNILFPFLRVTDRLLFQALRRSPLSFLDKNTRADWAAGGAARDIAIARTLYGTALIAYYWEQAGIPADQEGALEGEAPDDYKKQQSLESTGYRPDSVVSDGEMIDSLAFNLSMNPLDTQNNIANLVATIRKDWEASEESEDAVQALGNGIAFAGRSLLKILSSQSYAENLSGYLQPLTERDPNRRETAEAAFVGGLAAQFVPAAVRQFNQTITDPEKKVTKGDGSFGDRVKGRVISGIPGLSESLPDRVDFLGDKIPQGRTFLGINNRTEIKKDDVSQELRKIEREIPEPLLSGAPSSFRMEGHKITLTADQQQKWNTIQGQYIRQVMAEVIQNPNWKTADTSLKVKAIKELKKEAYEATKLQILPDLDFDLQVEKIDD